MRIGWIGLGAMALGMERCAARTGHTVIGHTHGRAAQEALLTDGGSVSADLAMVVTDTDIVCINVFNEEQIGSVLCDDGVLARLSVGSTLIVHTTSPRPRASTAAGCARRRIRPRRRFQRLAAAGCRRRAHDAGGRYARIVCTRPTAARVSCFLLAPRRSARCGHATQAAQQAVVCRARASRRGRLSNCSLRGLRFTTRLRRANALRRCQPRARDPRCARHHRGKHRPAANRRRKGCGRRSIDVRFLAAVAHGFAAGDG